MRLYSYVMVALLVLPTFSVIFYGLLWNSPSIVNVMLTPIVLTLAASGLAALCLSLVLTPVAFYLSMRPNAVLEALVDVPASVPHPVMGIGILLLFSEYTPIGQLARSLGLNVFDTFLGLLLALVTVSAPVYVRSMREAFSALPKEQFEVFSTLGFGLWKQFVSVALPQVKASVLNSALTAMGRAISEFGSVAVVAYYVLTPPFYGAKYASVMIYDIFSYQGLQAAVAASAILIAVGLLVSTAARAVVFLKRMKQ